MQTNNFNNLQTFLSNWKQNDKYFQMLELMAKLSKLFSENEVPYLDYRLTENLFCLYFQALNDARSCTAYDARINNLGIGIKTFIIDNNSSLEKIAEFNKLKTELNKYSGKELAIKLATFRNDRMQFANDTFNVTETQYHIVGRKKGFLRIFNSPYEKINIQSIKLDKDTDKSLSFNDGINEYTFNKSKSVLMKRFVVPNDFKDIDIEIIDNPLLILEELINNNRKITLAPKALQKGVDFVILPLYSVRQNKVPEKSQLNQWNADGRKRDINEVYIPIPKAIHKFYPNFFPKRETPFSLSLPDGTILSAKICQEGGKALMSNPNKALGEWILRKILHKKEGDLVTMNDLNKYGIDSIYVEKTHTKGNDELEKFKISFSSNYRSYSNFICEE